VAAPLWDREGQRVGAIEVLRDITDKKLAEDEMGRLRNYLSSIINSMPSLLIGLSRDQRVTLWNAAAEQATGLSAAAAQGRLFQEVIPSLAEYEDKVERAMRSGQVQLEAKVGRKINGESRYQDVTIYPLVSSGGDGVVIRVDDVTERVRIEEMMVQSEKMLSVGGLAAGMAHEINNPLGIMMGFCELLLEKMEPGTMEYSDLKTIERHGLHCKSIVERLLNFARMSEETEARCDLNASVEAILAVVKHTLAMNNTKLITDLEEGLETVGIDSRGLQQVLLNLISNALHAMPGKGVLGISTRHGKEAGWAEVVVADTGCGIAKEFLPRIFDPFFTTKKVGEGTGLGLSVSYGIVTQYGGCIECDSYTEDERPGGAGTTFLIRLPFDRVLPDSGAGER